MSPKTVKLERNVALCYIRQSLTRNENDMDSPDRQKANIEAVLARKGLVGEFYYDTVGHKSGRSEKNRLGWLGLKARISDPDVAAVVANDLSRFHRKLSRLSDLLDQTDECGVVLILAASGRDLDTSTPIGRTIAQFMALQDEAYAVDIGYRAKDNAAYRRKLGKINGTPPFGTKRNTDGFLMPTPQGAWELADGTWITGSAVEPPTGAIRWRSYYRCARRMLILYASGRIGYDRIAYRLNEDGWRFRDHKNTPRLITSDDVRRVVANWPEYGGMMVDKPEGKSRSKDRSAKRGIATLSFRPERAVMPLKLLLRVTQAVKARAIERPDQGVIRKAHIYPLNRVTFCAHCERLAEAQANPKLRSTLSGNNQQGLLRYRHKGGVKCGCVNRSVPAEAIEEDFGRLLKLLTVAPDKLNLLTELAIQLEYGRAALEQDAQLDTHKQEAIALCQRRIDAAIYLYGDGRISREEYLKRIDDNEREIAHWESRTTDTQKAAIDLALCMNVVSQIASVWDKGSAADKQALVQGLFVGVYYDLDTRRITGFKLKPWADKYLVVRANLNALESDTDHAESKAAPANVGMEQDVPLSGFEPEFQP